MTTWLDRPLYALDAETTGTDPHEARVLTVCLGYSDGPGHWAPRTFHVVPDVPIPAEATAIHGLTLETVTEAANGLSRHSALEKVWLWIEGASIAREPIIGHNLHYDLTLLDAEFRRVLDEPLPSGLIVLDTLVLYRRLWRQTGSRTLGKLAERHGITFPAHDAEADALASLRLLHILANDHDLLRHVPAAALHELQGGWWAEAQEADAMRAAANGYPREPARGWPVAEAVTVP